MKSTLFLILAITIHAAFAAVIANEIGGLVSDRIEDIAAILQ